MTSMTIRNIPDDILQSLKVRATQSGKSLQAYAIELFAREVSKPTLADMAARMEREASAELSTEDVLKAIEDGRERR
ncbi:FitA-like ribbon-helix-helix domain-containing protein [Streptomyces gobiensis]|uniref:FitA-like ribbon-helix-helix domain-containing protein n=1 Tax=Streptomyces gobiensis TaxID=2875706 RepID=UPI001E2EC44D|nr:antitoxin [Streptomyces gobiensis]UGY93061.1 antitoxin [Streptomyces gobiensis]